MKVLFVMLNGGYVRNYEGVIRQLAAEGHQIHIAMEVDRNKMNENVLAQRLAAETANVTVGLAAAPDDDHWFRAARSGRMLVDYLRYLAPQYRDATTLRARAFGLLHRCFRPFVRLVGRFGSPGASVVIRALIAAERAVPLSRSVTAFLQAQRPDVLLVTPLVDPGSIQVDYIKCARHLGIPTALCVASWDNLTNKGAMRVVPDRVFVWNEPQRDEAVTLHRVPRERVTVTGAQLFDHWFTWTPSRTREAFCTAIGLDPTRPFVLYLGSSFFIAPTEAEFGGRWVAALRQASDPVVAQAGILIRPHPSSGGQWHGLDLSKWHHTAVWPPAGVDLFATEFKHDLFDSLHYCSAVVAVNTSAQIEAAILGKVVCTVQAPDFEHSQRGTLHFQHLVNGGLLQVAQTLDAHVGQLGAILRDPAAQAGPSRRFVDYFVRPFGRDVDATPRLTAAIVDLAAMPSPTRAPAVLASVFRLLLLPLAYYVAWLPERRPLWVYAMRPVVNGWAYFRLRRHWRAHRERQAAILAKQLRKQERPAVFERRPAVLEQRPAVLERRPVWTYVLRVAVEVWVYFHVLPHRLAERDRQASQRAKQLRAQQRSVVRQRVPRPTLTRDRATALTLMGAPAPALVSARTASAAARPDKRRGMPVRTAAARAMHRGWKRAATPVHRVRKRVRLVARRRQRRQVRDARRATAIQAALLAAPSSVASLTTSARRRSRVQRRWRKATAPIRRLRRQAALFAHRRRKRWARRIAATRTTLER
jgi:hypothetical protein